MRVADVYKLSNVVKIVRMSSVNKSKDISIKSNLELLALRMLSLHMGRSSTQTCLSSDLVHPGDSHDCSYHDSNGNLPHRLERSTVVAQVACAYAHFEAGACL